MFGIDFSEILVIFGIALVVLGPERLPKLAATIGRWLGRARSMARQFREQLEQEANRLQHETKGLHDSVNLKDLNVQSASDSAPAQDVHPEPTIHPTADPTPGAPVTPSAAAEFGLHNAGAPEANVAHAQPQPQPQPQGAPTTPHASPAERPVAVEAHE